VGVWTAVGAGVGVGGTVGTGVPVGAGVGVGGGEGVMLGDGGGDPVADVHEVLGGKGAPHVKPKGVQKPVW
jgi:hypothetical protein